MNKINEYNLVHITTDGEYKAPLVASQLFDQAEFQATNRQGFAPGKVEAWTIGPMREYFDEGAKKKMAELRARCPHIKIRMVNGVGRFKMLPAYPLLLTYRRRLGKLPVIYHCRGENAAVWAARLKQAFPGDRVVLDVRGYWPAEVIYNKGVEDPSLAKGDDLAAYQRAYHFLSYAISIVDAVTTVSTALRDLLIKEHNAPADTYVVPCCIAHLTPDNRRLEIRKSWGVADDEIVLVYSGGTAAYQHLEDLTIPFLKKVMERNTKIRLAFLSSEQEKIKNMLVAAGIYSDRIILKGFPQKEVGEALTACDAGILIRKPTIVNAVANPVKIAEYLGSGLPIIIEKNVGGVADVMFEQSILKGIRIAAPGADMDSDADAVNKWLGEDLPGKRTLARAYAEKVYLWSSAINVSRKMYESALNK